MLKAIETAYKGYRFRSRLEARHAVFMDTLGVRWDYEKEGFELSPAGRYLPDFWLPDLKCWYEVKADWPDDRENRVAQALADASQFPVYVSIGDLHTSSEVLGDGQPHWRHRILHYEPDQWETPWDDACWWAMCLDCGNKGIGLWGQVQEHREWCLAKRGQRSEHDELVLAIRAARGARFEFGETPRL